MISKRQIIPLLMEACPSFRLPDEHREPLYVMLGTLAHHLLTLQQQQQTGSFPAVALVIERLHTEGDDDVREAATIGLLEAIQNVWGHAGVDPELFGRYLLPESAKWWRSLHDFWSGQRNWVAVGR